MPLLRPRLVLSPGLLHRLGAAPGFGQFQGRLDVHGLACLEHKQASPTENTAQGISGRVN